MYCSASATLWIRSSCRMIAMVIEDFPRQIFILGGSDISRHVQVRMTLSGWSPEQKKRGAAKIPPRLVSRNWMLPDVSEAVYKTNVDAEVVLDGAMRLRSSIQRIEAEEGADIRRLYAEGDIRIEVVVDIGAETEDRLRR